MRVCGIATCDDDDVATLLGTCSDASPDAFTVLHDAFLAGGAFVQVPARRRGRASRSSSCTGREGDGRASFPHTLVVARRGAPRSRCSTASARPTTRSPRRRASSSCIVGDNAHVRYLSVQEHGPRTWQLGAAARARRPRRDAASRRPSRSAATTPGCAARRCSTGQGAESDLLAVYFGDGTQMLDFRTLQDHDAPHTRSDLLFKGAVEDDARSVYSGLVRLRPDGAEVERATRPTATSCSPRARARSRSRTSRSRPTTCSARTRRTVGPIDDDQLYYLETRGVPPEEAERLIVLGFFDERSTSPRPTRSYGCVRSRAAASTARPSGS